MHVAMRYGRAAVCPVCQAVSEVSAYADKVISFEVAVCDEPFEKQTNGGYEEISEKYGYIAHRFNLP